MPERPKDHSSTSGDPDAELAAVLSAARKALRRGDGWDIEPCHLARLHRDCAALGISPTEPSLTIAIRTAFGEITRLRRRTDESYAGLALGQTLYEARWLSSHFGRMMYIKFALCGETVELLTFHEHVEKTKSHEVH